MAAVTPATEMFRGQHSLRFRGERAWLWIDLLFAPATVGIVGSILHSPFRMSELGVILVAAVVFVTLSRGRLLGTSVRVHEGQFPELFAVVERCSRQLGMRAPQVFLREDPIVPITALGLGEPYSIVISSSWLRHFDEKELEFLIGCELGHIAAGQTRISSLFSASGRENPLIALVFGAWLRRTEYTASRVGLVCCRSIDAAVRAIYATSFRDLKGHVRHAAFVEQRLAIESDPSLAMGEWLSESPYAVNRMKELERFATAADYAYWSRYVDEWMASGARPEAPVYKPVKASLYLRSLAFVVDVIVVGAISASGAFVVHVTTNKNDLADAIHELDADPKTATLGHWLATHASMTGADLAPVCVLAGVMLYSALMVAVVGRTCGMLVFDLRVVRKDFSPAKALRAVWRYLLALVSFVTVVPLLVGLVSGWWPHELLSGTQLVRGGVPQSLEKH
jgi:uncharacterized RDD family membrane protein YckC